MRGKLISFDGLDSSGKETQTRRTIERLQAAGHTVHHFETPDYDTPSGQDLKARLQNKIGNWQTTPWQEKVDFFATNRAENKGKVTEALARGDIVVYDRYLPSSLAFMAIEALSEEEMAGSRQDVYNFVMQKEYKENGMPQEDISFFLDVPPRVADELLHKRKANLGHGDEYTDHIEVQERLYREYEHLCASNPARYVRIQCVQAGKLLSIETINDRIWKHLLPLLP